MVCPSRSGELPAQLIDNNESERENDRTMKTGEMSINMGNVITLKKARDFLVNSGSAKKHIRFLNNFKRSSEASVNDTAYTEKMESMMEDPRIQQMKKFRQHRTSNTFNHVCHVARMSYRISQKLHIEVNEDSMLRGAMLHDYYLYDLVGNPMGAYRHGTTHPVKALENASQEFDLNEKERNIIESHMWPLTLLHLPKSREAWIVSVADKICAVKEAVAGTV